MSSLIDALRDKGCDIDGTMSRFLNNEDFYKRCYTKLWNDPSFKGLGEALDARDVESAFHFAHTMKGVLANMGITPLLNEVIEIVEPLRAGQLTDEIIARYNTFMVNVEEYKKLAE